MASDTKSKSRGGSNICDKHSLVIDVIRAALEDGQNMESALYDRKIEIEQLKEEKEELQKQLDAMTKERDDLIDELKSRA